MMETVFEQEKKAVGSVAEFHLPNNRRQKGRPQGGAIEVFVEDYAYMYARRLSGRNYTGCVAGVLVGQSVTTDGKSYVLIQGVLELKEDGRNDKVEFSEEKWTELYHRIREFFPRCEVVGWFLGGPGFMLEDTEAQKKVQKEHFGGGDKVMFKLDSVEGEEQFYVFRNGRLEQLDGYYIYYEKNEEMQNYLMGLGQNEVVAPEMSDGNVSAQRQYSEPVVSRSVVSGRIPAERVTSGRLEKLMSGRGVTRLFYATGCMAACLVLVVMAAFAIRLNEREKLKQLLNEPVVAASSVRQVYEVLEGETIESICEKVYGTTEISEQIRYLNGLSEKENPVAGAKLFLP